MCVATDELVLSSDESLRAGSGKATSLLQQIMKEGNLSLLFCSLPMSFATVLVYYPLMFLSSFYCCGFNICQVCFVSLDLCFNHSCDVVYESVNTSAILHFIGSLPFRS